MSAETQLAAVLLAAPAVTALVGTGAGARIYPDIAPQEVALPCVAFTRVGTEVVGTFSTPIAASKATLECFCMAASRADAEQLADAVNAAVAAAWFIPSSRRSEQDGEAALWASVLVLDYWES